MTVLQTSRLCLILGCLALLYFVRLFQMNGIYLVSSGFPPFEKETEGKKDYGQSALSMEKRKVKQMKNGSREDIWRRYVICAVQEKAFRFCVV